MKKPANVREIYLQPGQFHFGERNTRIRTILGSCVSIVMWHEKHLIGGMCHYILPKRNRSILDKPDGRYAEEAIELFMARIHTANTRSRDYQVKIFGGGNMFPQYTKRGKCADVPCQNVIAARTLIKRYGLNLVGEHLGGAGHRQIYFDIWNGHVWMRRVEITTASAASDLS
jgi:chemotaxis protein CheD